MKKIFSVSLMLLLLAGSGYTQNLLEPVNSMDDNTKLAVQQISVFHQDVKAQQVEGILLERNALTIDLELYPGLRDKKILEFLISESFQEFNILEQSQDVLFLEVLDKQFKPVIKRIVYFLAVESLSDSSPEIAGMKRAGGGSFDKYYLEYDYYTDDTYSTWVGNYTRHCCGGGYRTGGTSVYCTRYSALCEHLGCGTVPGTTLFLQGVCY